MKILNLVYPEKSDIKYKISKFPSGQQNVVLDADTIPVFDRDKESYQIKSRLNNWLDLELIICSVASLRELGVEEIHLYVPFIDGRQDRKFEEGGNNYLRDVLSLIINSLGCKTVTCIDSHSYVTEACIKNFKSVNNHGLVGYALDDLKYDRGSDKFILVSPDAGASKKIYKLAEQIGYKGDIITCSKERDEDSKLTKCVVPLKAGEHLNKDFIIIDDICDGGNTFINIVKELKEIRTQYSKQKIYLIVTHGIFSAGYSALSKYFDGIYCTNSYSDLPNGYMEAAPLPHNYLVFPNLIKQLNVF